MPESHTGGSPAPLADTQYDIDTREAYRYPCLDYPALRVMVRPTFERVTIRVRDVSAKGLGFLSPRAIEPGSWLAILWDFGPPQRWRTIRARAAHLTRRHGGNWFIGCAFDGALTAEEFEAFLRQDRDVVEGDCAE